MEALQKAEQAEQTTVNGNQVSQVLSHTDKIGNLCM